METPNSSSWSELPCDLVASIFDRLSLADFHRAKIVCWNWNSSTKRTVLRRSESPWLMLFTEGHDGCALYNPEEDRFYRTKRKFSGIRFLANSGSWFLVLDSRISNLYIIDVFSDKRIDLPPLESHLFIDFKYFHVSDACAKLKGVLWVNEKNEEEYAVVWFFHYDGNHTYLAFFKNGEDHYTEIPTRFGVCMELIGISDSVLRGYTLYVLTNDNYIRILDLFGKQGFYDVTTKFPLFPSNYDEAIAVTSSGEVLFVMSILDDKTNNRIFHFFKKVPNRYLGGRYHQLVNVGSLGDDEALLMDLGITVPCIKPNSIYFTRHDRVRVHHLNRGLDIGVFNHATKTLKRFPCLSNLKLKDARWFLPSFGGA